MCAFHENIQHHFKYKMWEVNDNLAFGHGFVANKPEWEVKQQVFRLQE